MVQTSVMLATLHPVRTLPDLKLYQQMHITLDAFHLKILVANAKYATNNLMHGEKL
jgi:hypothetical protein